MFSFFQKKERARDLGDETVSPNSLLPRRMDLEERKAFRRDLLDQAIRESLQLLSAVTGSYRFRTMPLDLRHHRFVVMIDVGPSFQPRQGSRSWNFPDIEALIRKNAYERFGLLVDGIYWRVSADLPARAAPEETTIAAPRPYQLVSDEEKQALMEAIRRGSELPVLHVGDLEYQSEMAPLDEAGRRGGPPYDERP